jgi:hypothetical protein
MVVIKLNTTAVDHEDAIATVIPSLIKLLGELSTEEAASAIANLAVHGSSHLSIVEVANA